MPNERGSLPRRKPGILFTSSPQRAKITSSLLCLLSSLRPSEGGGKQGASVDGATHDFSRCGDATPIKRFRFGPRTETTFCSPLRLSSLCLPHMCVPKASRSPVTFRACARWHQSTQRFLQSRPTKEKRSEAWLITRSYSLQSALLREPIIRRQTSGSLRRGRRRRCPLC